MSSLGRLKCLFNALSLRCVTSATFTDDTKTHSCLGIFGLDLPFELVALGLHGSDLVPQGLDLSRIHTMMLDEV